MSRNLPLGDDESWRALSACRPLSGNDYKQIEPN